MRTPPAPVVEAFAQAVCQEDILRDLLRTVFRIPEPEKYDSIIAVTQAGIDGEFPRFHADPMAPVSCWVAWNNLRSAGRVWDRYFGKEVPRG